MQRPIVVVGSINTDLVVSAERIPSPGETIAGRSFDSFQGGKGANQAVAVAKLGYPVILLGKVGTDDFGAASLAHLKTVGVDVSQVSEVPGASGVALITVGEDGENTIVVVPGANGEVTADYVERHRPTIRSAAMVLTQLEIPVEAVAHLAAICRQERVPLMLDPAPAVPLPPGLLAQFAWVTPNETEAKFYAGESADPAASLLALGVKRLVLKQGRRGALLASVVGERTEIPAFPVEAVDSTAAGDCFNGAFAVCLVCGGTAEDSARFAAAAAALSVTRQGAQASMPGFDEVQSFMNH